MQNHTFFVFWAHSSLCLRSFHPTYFGKHLFVKKAHCTQTKKIKMEPETLAIHFRRPWQWVTSCDIQLSLIPFPQPMPQSSFSFPFLTPKLHFLYLFLFFPRKNEDKAEKRQREQRKSRETSKKAGALPAGSWISVIMFPRQRTTCTHNHIIDPLSSVFAFRIPLHHHQPDHGSSKAERQWCSQNQWKDTSRSLFPKTFACNAGWLKPNKRKTQEILSKNIKNSYGWLMKI